MAMRESGAPYLKICSHRPLDDVRVDVIEASPGTFEGRPGPDTQVMFHLGAPARICGRHDDVASSRVIRRGQFDLIPPYCPRVWAEGDPTVSLNVWLSPALLVPLAEGMAFAGRRPFPERRIAEDDGRAFQTALMLQAEAESAQPDRLFARSLATALAVRLLTRFGFRETAARGAFNGPQRRTLTDHIRANLDGDLSLSVLAGLVDLSPSHFQVRFRQTFGRSVHRYVVDLRLQEAKQMLMAGALSIADVAAATGFCHQSHLTRTMRGRLGLTPADLTDGRRKTGPPS